ncbi:UvrD-helicase domain-containing protein [Microvirga splendida]|uniref:DNA 3'-5' helicase n=1 Tax=Microvirga splendida TaxID=2795727 RepID=A0ABS0XZB1_9HYPH|nr:UvrD-helicase domain-containing protein [Microvirga splendida]MBJ6125391.1 UvrD-helicase domain-containing protein [Microvirga splendida]
MTNRVDTNIASAGTGKTTKIVGLIAEDMKSVEPETILATTFTVKAADELMERARAELVKQGRGPEAVRLLSAMVGTINSVCGRIVSEFAIDLGRSPTNQVIAAEERDELIRLAADPVFARHAPNILKLWEALGLGELKDKGDWRKHVACIIEKADENGLGAGDLGVSARKSIEALSEFMTLPEDHEAPDTWDGDLRDAMVEAVRSSDGVKLTKDGKDSLADIEKHLGRLDRGERICWPDWVRLSKLKHGTKDAEKAVFRDVKGAAGVFPRHPALRSDMERYIEAVFECAAEVMQAYAAYKREHGLIDFPDQLCLALEILRKPEFKERLRERIGLVYVDEYQDSSPIQVALFLALARIAPRSVWVGDPKQAIYSFRGTDPILTMSASLEVAEKTGGTRGILSESFRSRPGIIELVNDMFVPAFVRMGLPESESTYEKVRRPADPDVSSPVAVWHLDGNTLPKQSAALAAGVADMLANPSAWPVGAGDTTRPLRPGDVAVLCRDNDDVYRVTAALAQKGIEVAAEQKGLFETEEVELALAALRWTADPTNYLALAEIARLLGGIEQPTAWLDAVLQKDHEALECLVPFTEELKDIRDRQLQLTPSEILDEILIAARVAEHACRWGKTIERLDCLEKLRSLARKYETKCRSTGLPATLAGLATSIEDGKAMRPSSRNPNAVNVLTYHKGKGLEWPVVICLDLDSIPKTWPVTMPTIATDGSTDWSRPLEGRWIRFWPYPFGLHKAGVGIDVTWPGSETGRRVIREADEEATRLLYVGVTRARDHAVLCATDKGTAWLERLAADPVNPHVTIPVSEGQPLVANGREHQVRFARFAGTEAVETVRIAPYVSLPRPAATHLPLRIRPSAATDEGIEYAFSHTILSGGVPIVGNPEMDELGSALHAILAADDDTKSLAERVASADAILKRWDMKAITAVDVIAAADKFWDHLRKQYPTAKIHREVPVHAYDGLQVISGIIDVLIDGPEDEGWFIIGDHKSFPGKQELWDERAKKHAPQLGSYSKAVATALGGRKRCAGCFVHMPIRGVVISTEVQEANNSEMVATIA